jgi:hypothetical protein
MDKVQKPSDYEKYYYAANREDWISDRMFQQSILLFSYQMTRAMLMSMEIEPRLLVLLRRPPYNFTRTFIMDEAYSPCIPYLKLLLYAYAFMQPF